MLFPKTPKAGHLRSFMFPSIINLMLEVMEKEKARGRGAMVTIIMDMIIRMDMESKESNRRNTNTT